MRRAAIALVLALSPGPVWAGLTEEQLGRVELTPPPGAQAPLGVALRDIQGRAITLGEAVGGRPTLLMPVDYTCRETCGPALSITATALSETGLQAGRDYSLVVLGIDERDGPDAARAFTEGQVGGPGTAVLVGDEAAIRAVTDAIGYHFERDVANDRIAHPAGFVSLTADGRVSRALSSLALEPTDLRLALTEAGEGRIGGLLGRLALLCYGFDAVHGVYTRRIETALRIGGALTLTTLAAAIGLMAWRSRNRGVSA